MNKIKTNVNGVDIELWYGSMNNLEAVYKADGTPLMIETMYSCPGYKIQEEKGTGKRRTKPQTKDS